LHFCKERIGKLEKGCFIFLPLVWLYKHKLMN